MGVAGSDTPVAQDFSGGRLGGSSESIREFANSFFLSLRLIVLSVKHFRRIPTKEEWSRFRKYTRGIRTLRMDDSGGSIAPDVLLALQLRTGNEPLLPRLGTFKCKAVSQAFVPFIPLFLSSRTSVISIGFAGVPAVMVASTIARLSTLCPDIQSLFLFPIPNGQVIAEAASELLLACNRDTLQFFLVDSPLTEDARGILYKLPKLRQLRTTIQGPTLLPRVALPDLKVIWVQWDSSCDWLQGFRGATVGRLQVVIFRPISESAQIGDFLEEFQSVALATSSQDTLSIFCFYTSQSWSPNYSSLLGFKQIARLKIEFSCRDGCSSTVDDDIIISLAQAMPKLEILRLGGAPCSALTGVTLKGLVALACHCNQLSELCVHLQAGKLAEAVASAEPPCPSENAAVIPRTDCALKNLQVGDTPIQRRVTSAVALTLLQVFPQILNVEYVDRRWEKVSETIKLFKRVGGHVDFTSKAHLLHLKYSLVTPYQETVLEVCWKTTGRDGVCHSLVLGQDMGSYLPKCNFL